MACSVGSSSIASAASAPPLPDNTRISKFNEDIYLGAQITSEDVDFLQKLGVKTIINVRKPTEQGFADMEYEFQARGLQYHLHPIDPNGYTSSTFDGILATLKTCAKPVLVFCRTATRAKAVVQALTATRARDTGVIAPETDFDKIPEGLRAFVRMYVNHKMENIGSLPAIEKVNDNLYIGPQVTEEQLKDLAAQGIKSVLNLRDPSEHGSLGLLMLDDEQKIVESLGMKYRNIPTPAEQSPSADAKLAVEAALAELDSPVFMHCRRINRSAALSGRHQTKDETQPQVFTLFDEITCTAQHLLVDPRTKATAIIDSVLDYNPANGCTSTTAADALIAAIEAHHLDVRYILETHVHADHISASAYLKKRFPEAKTGIGAAVTTVQTTFTGLFNLKNFKSDGSSFDCLFKDEDTFELGYLKIRVLHTPGHTPACVSYVADNCVFVGDTIFMPDMGTARCDFPGGSASQLYASVQKIFALPDDTRLFVGHDYAPGGRNYSWETTVGAEKANNKSLAAATAESEFVSWREGRDASLAVPRLIVPSLQMNLRAGNKPEPEDNGVSYFKLPINVLCPKEDEMEQ